MISRSTCRSALCLSYQVGSHRIRNLDWIGSRHVLVVLPTPKKAKVHPLTPPLLWFRSSAYNERAADAAAILLIMDHTGVGNSRLLLRQILDEQSTRHDWADPENEVILWCHLHQISMVSCHLQTTYQEHFAPAIIKIHWETGNTINLPLCPVVLRLQT